MSKKKIGFRTASITTRMSAASMSGRLVAHVPTAAACAVDSDLGDLTLSGNFDFFLHPTLSVGIGDDEFDDRWTLSGEKFFTARGSVRASYFEGNGGSADDIEITGFRIEGT